jgi:hypothetical protein
MEASNDSPMETHLKTLREQFNHTCRETKKLCQGKLLSNEMQYLPRVLRLAVFDLRDMYNLNHKENKRLRLELDREYQHTRGGIIEDMLKELRRSTHAYNRSVDMEVQRMLADSEIEVLKTIEAMTDQVDKIDMLYEGPAYDQHKRTWTLGACWDTYNATGGHDTQDQVNRAGGRPPSRMKKVLGGQTYNHV